MSDDTLMEAKRRSQALKAHAHSLMESNSKNPFGTPHGRSPPRLDSPSKRNSHRRSPRMQPARGSAFDTNCTADLPFSRDFRNMRESGQGAGTTFFDDFKTKVHEIRNTRYSPQKVQRQDRTKSPLPPVRFGENFFLLKIERQNERLEELEGTVRQLRLQNQHLEIFNDTLKEKDEACEKKLRHTKLALQRREQELDAQEQELKWKLDQIKSEQLKPQELRRPTQHVPHTNHRDYFFPTIEDYDRLKSSQEERIGRLECENGILRREIHDLKVEPVRSRRISQTDTLQEKLQTSLQIIGALTERIKPHHAIYDCDDSTEQLLAGDSSTIEFYRTYREEQYSGSAKSFRAYAIMILFIIRARRAARSKYVY